jgi:hypothetical protein
VLRVLAVELHQGDAGIGPGGLLCGEEGVEAADDVIGDAGQGAGAVEQEMDVGAVHGMGCLGRGRGLGGPHKKCARGRETHGRSRT